MAQFDTRLRHAFPFGGRPLALGSTSVAAQDPDAGKPIPNGPDTKINAQFREGYYRFYLQLAKAYRQHTADAAELKPLGVELLMEVAPSGRWIHLRTISSACGNWPSS